MAPTPPACRHALTRRCDDDRVLDRDTIVDAARRIRGHVRRTPVLVPTIASPTKLQRLREYGATVVARGTEYADAHDAAMEHVHDTGAVYVHAYDQPEVCAGAGTLGLELLEQVAASGGEVDTVLVAVGGGGLMAGVATAVEGTARVVGVE